MLVFQSLPGRQSQASPFFNQPEMCANASWSSTGTVFANRSTAGQEVLGLFIDKNNTVYVPNQANRTLSIWINGVKNNVAEVPSNPSESWSIFVANAETIFVDNGAKGFVDRRSSRSGTTVSFMAVTSACAGLFVDIDYNLYCALSSGFKVIKMSLNDTSKTKQTVAGTGTSGTGLDSLKSPRGIFVDPNFNLYVADYGNKRVLRFGKGQMTGSIVAGGGADQHSPAIGATGVVVGTDDRLYIVDNDKHQIVEASSTSVRCVVGCAGGFGAGLHQLHYPYTAAFDSFGNMFVSDQNNHRIMKFDIITTACSKFPSGVTMSMADFSSLRTEHDDCQYNNDWEHR